MILSANESRASTFLDQSEWTTLLHMRQVRCVVRECLMVQLCVLPVPDSPGEERGGVDLGGGAEELQRGHQPHQAVLGGPHLHTAGLLWEYFYNITI